MRDTDEREQFEAELEREVPASHVLHGVQRQVVAVRRNNKRSVWWLPETEQWAIVHLTWTIETDSRWPSTDIVTTWAEVVDDLGERGRS